MGARVVFAIMMGVLCLCAQQPPAAQNAGATTAKPASKKTAPVNIRVSVNVVDPKGAPVANAGVVIRQNLDSHGAEPRNPFQVELETDTKGDVQVQGFEPGQVSVQVIAHGFQTWGELIAMKSANEAVNIKLSLPKPQVTIY